MGGRQSLNKKDEEDIMNSFQQAVEKKQMVDSMTMYNRMTERCFSECVTRFLTAKLEKTEDRCISRCAEKWLKLSTKASLQYQRMQEEEGQRMEAAAAAAAPPAK